MQRVSELESEVQSLKAAGVGAGVMSRLFQIPTKEDVLNGEEMLGQRGRRWSGVTSK